MHAQSTAAERGASSCSACSATGPVRLIFERSVSGHRGYRFPALDVPAADPAALIPGPLLRRRPPRLPEVTEPEVARHYVALSLFNHHVDRSLYPLGSCTMKYNPKVNEELARHPGFAGLHPEAPEALLQGLLELLWSTERALAEIVGMDAVSLQPAAGAQGELLGMKLLRAYLRSRGADKRTVLIPDSAHGTNPASVVFAGFEPRQIPSRADGRVDLQALAAAIDNSTAGIMITNPNTLGIFETEIDEIAARIHAVDGLVYMDGANLNALMGLSRPGDMGVDMVHMNLHKTFSTPHGGGGPGAGPVGVKAKLAPFLPVPVIERDGDRFRLVEERPESVGRLHPFGGNVGVILRAYAYIRRMGGEGLAAASRAALVNANYLMRRVAEDFPAAKPGPCMHEFVSSAAWTRKHEVRNIDVAKRLLDYGFHSPTVSFPLIVPDALMIEPTETETRAGLDAFAAAMRAIAAEVRERPAVVRAAPSCTCVGRLDEAEAARRLKVRCRFDEGASEG
ncbi:MAG: aminomethyl-transferring glycine dehydrogenase subunit GcvPB [Candidatus Eisenbacteria bacterium]|uniref:glycine dehydrogenase (aminomethyl-transferring) n=1 Tax=Eiseniibacteriota bacterium TaxID=2212470 RepID=A0A937X8X3_UNCEI|nr:aminomethyl-transferring glycine dehydrogenase subunit GcvPB [Candidatus Eisenbacteria bacterium]